MFSLRTFHLLFVIIVVIAADMFGAWAIWEHARAPSVGTLAAGIVSFAASFGLIGYAIWFVRKLDRAKIA